MVFCNKRLRDRDQEEYALFWRLAGLTEKVAYQVGLDFEHNGNELLLIDESDTLIFADPLIFLDMMMRARCICMTATPDDNNRKGGEK